METETFVRPDFEEDQEFGDLSDQTPELPNDEDGFPTGVHEDFFGLTQIGYLEKTFDLYGHTVSIRTLKSGEELAAGLIIKKYDGSMSQGKAGFIAFVSACLVAVDNQPLPRTFGNNAEGNVEERFNYVLREYDFETIVAPIYAEFQMLNQHKIEVANQLRSK